MVIRDDNFLMYACKAYNGCNISEKEFFSDLRKISQISRHLTRYQNKHEVNLRIIINLIITFFNVFEMELGTKIILFRLDKTLHNKFCTVLFFMDMLSISIKNEFNINIDEEFLKILKKQIC